MTIADVPSAVIERFWQRVDTQRDQRGCRLWTSYCKSRGYGLICWGYPRRIRMAAHRLSYIIAHGQLDDNLNVLHTCNVTRCVNPDHLYAGTQQDNVRDRDRQGRGRARFQSGEAHPRARLRWADVHALRASHAAGCGTRALAVQYGLSLTQVRDIVRHKSWKEEGKNAEQSQGIDARGA